MTEGTCARCGQPFRGQTNRVYCSAGCRYAARHARDRVLLRAAREIRSAVI